MDLSLQTMRDPLQHFNPDILVNGDFKAFMEATIYLDPTPNDEAFVSLLQ